MKIWAVVMVTGAFAFGTGCGSGSSAPTIDVHSCHMAPSAGPGDSIEARRPDGPLERGAFVRFEPPNADGPDLVSSRVVGLPGEVIESRDGVVLIDGDSGIDIWGATAEPADFGPVDLGEDEYFMLADNRAGAQDSRFYGPVAGSAVDLVGELPPAEPGDTSSECHVSGRSNVPSSDSAAESSESAETELACSAELDWIEAENRAFDALDDGDVEHADQLVAEIRSAFERWRSSLEDIGIADDVAPYVAEVERWFAAADDGGIVAYDSTSQDEFAEAADQALNRWFDWSEEHCR